MIKAIIFDLSGVLIEDPALGMISYFPAMKYFNEQNPGLFDATVFSCIEGTTKPERRIYEIALERVGVQPNEAVFVDDREDFIDGAKRVGINTILFASPSQVKRELAFFSVRTR